MKTRLILDSALGKACSHLLLSLLTDAATKNGLKLVQNDIDIDLLILVGEHTEEAIPLRGKNIFQGKIEEAAINPDAFLQKSISLAKPYKQSTNITVVPSQKKIIAITACSTGVAHAFMAALAIEEEAKKRGWWFKIETHGAVGYENTLTAQEIREADVVIIAADIRIDLHRFTGKTMYTTSTSFAINKTIQMFDDVLQQDKVLKLKYQNNSLISRVKNATHVAYSHLLTGFSYILPIVVTGGICIALSLIFGINHAEQKSSLAEDFMQTGSKSALTLIAPVLSGFIALSIAGRPGLAPGLIGGMMAINTNAGFIGDIISGFFAGYIAKLINDKLSLPKNIIPLKSILIVPFITTLATGILIIYVVVRPMTFILYTLTNWLQSIGIANSL